MSIDKSVQSAIRSVHYECRRRGPKCWRRIFIHLYSANDTPQSRMHLLNMLLKRPDQAPLIYIGSVVRRNQPLEPRVIGFWKSSTCICSFRLPEISPKLTISQNRLNVSPDFTNSSSYPSSNRILTPPAQTRVPPVHLYLHLHLPPNLLDLPSSDVFCRCLHRFMEYKRPTPTRRIPKKRTAAVAIMYVEPKSFEHGIGSPTHAEGVQIVCRPDGGSPCPSLNVRTFSDWAGVY